MRTIHLLAWMLMPVLVTVIARPWWLGILVAVGFAFLYRGLKVAIGWQEGSAGMDLVAATKGYTYQAVLGTGLVATAAAVGDLDGRFVWTGVFLVTAEPLAMAGYRTLRHVSPGRGVLLLVLAVAALAAAVVAPFVHHGPWDSTSFYPWVLAWSVVMLGVPFAVALRGHGTQRALVGLGTALILTLGLVAGGATRDALVGGLVMVGLFALFRNMARISAGAVFDYRRLAIEMLIGLALVTAAALLDGIEVGWLWSSLWVISAVPPMVLGAEVFVDDESDASKADRDPVWSYGLLVISAVFLLTALAGPWLLAGLAPSRAVWVMALLAIGLLAIIAGWSDAQTGSAILFVLPSLLGLGALVAAWSLSDGVGTGVWRTVWIAAALLLWYGTTGTNRLWSKIVGVVLCLGTVGATILGDYPTSGGGSGVWVPLLVVGGALLLVVGGAPLLVGAVAGRRGRRRGRAAASDRSSGFSLVDPQVLQALSALEEQEKRGGNEPGAPSR